MLKMVLQAASLDNYDDECNVAHSLPLRQCLISRSYVWIGLC